jgi:hypothetical protein
MRASSDALLVAGLGTHVVLLPGTVRIARLSAFRTLLLLRAAPAALRLLPRLGRPARVAEALLAALALLLLKTGP